MDTRREFSDGIDLALTGAPASPALAAALTDDALALAPHHGQRAVLRAETLCAAVFNHRHQVIDATAAWPTAWRGAGWHADVELPANPLQPMQVAHDDAAGSLLIWAHAATARSWALPAALLSALARPDAARLVLAVQPMAAEDALQAAGRALGLTAAQGRVLAAVLGTGSIRLAAAQMGIGYDTARGAVSDAMLRVGVPRLPALLDRLTMLALGVWPQDGGVDQASQLADMLGLTMRQARLALALALGQTRAEAAASIGISKAVAKKAIDQLFVITGVNSATALVRRLAEARAMMLMSGISGGVVWAEEGLTPLRLVARPDGSQIAVSDYGPAGAPPVLVVHSSMSTRPVARQLLHGLQRAGYRVLAIDRPGFGLSDMVDAPCPFAAAAEDLATVLDALKIDRIAMVTRGAGQFALAAGRRLPDRLDRVVIVNPDPPSALSGDANGVISVLKTLFWRNPTMVRAFARLLASQYTPERAETIIRRTVEASPPDRAFMADPSNVADYYLASRAVATGRYQGYIAEQTLFATIEQDDPLTLTKDWTVLVGGVDVIHDPARVADYWRQVLPDAAHVMVAGAGRFLAMTHTAAVLSALAPTPTIR